MKCVFLRKGEKAKDISDREKGVYKGMELIKGKFHGANSKYVSVARAGSAWEINQGT